MKWLNEFLKKIINRKNDITGLIQIIANNPSRHRESYSISYVITKEYIICGCRSYRVNIYLDDILAVENYEMIEIKVLDIASVIGNFLYYKIEERQNIYYMQKQIMKKIKIKKTGE